MAAPNHHHHHLRRSCRPAAASFCCDCSSCCCCGGGGGSESPPPPQTDPLLQALAARLLAVQPPQGQTTIYSHLLKPLHHHSQVHHQQKHPLQQEYHTRTQTRNRSAVAALLRRIDALEASLAHFRPSHSSSFSSLGFSNSLRDAAARTIQTHFRAFLVRRSRTLRHLKDLAFIKSGVNALKSSVSDQAHLDPAAVSHKAMDLLLKLDSIKDGDPMIRDGRRSIRNELLRFLEFSDGASVKISEIAARAVRSMRIAHKNRKPRVLAEKLGREPGRRIPRFSRVCEMDEEEDDETEGFHPASDDEENTHVFIQGKHGAAQARNGVWLRSKGLQPKVKKTVRFADKGDLPPNADVAREGVSIDDQIELVENLCRELEEAGGLGTEDDEEETMENGESPPNSECERSPGRKSRTGANIRGHQHEEPNEEFMFSAPLPVKMEPRADLMNKRERL